MEIAKTALKRMAALLLLAFLQQACAPAPVRAFPGTIPENLGINVGFTKARPGEMELLKDLHFGWVRTELDFDSAKPGPPYDFSPYDSIINEFDSQGFRLIVILFAIKGDDIAPPRTAEERKAFVDWAVEIVRRYKGRGILWEFWNEPNSNEFWPPDPNVEDYARLSLELGRALKDACPGELLIGPNPAVLEPPGMDVEFISACLEKGLLKYWDAVSFHPYVFEDPEVVRNDYARIRELIRRHAPKGKEVPMINSESGFPWSGGDWASEAWQARNDVRRFLFDLSEGLVLSTIYSLEDTAPSPDQTWEPYNGLVGFEYDPKATPVRRLHPAYSAVRHLNQVLAGFGFDKRLDGDGPDNYVLRFRNASGEARYALWTTAEKGSRADLSVEVAEPFKVLDLFGGSLDIRDASSLPLDASVKYLIVDPR